MTFDTTTIVLIVLILVGLLLMVLGLRAVRKAPPKVERQRGAGRLPLLVELLGLVLVAWLIGLGIGWLLRRRAPRSGYLS